MQGLHRLMEEDTALRVHRDEQTKEFVVSGAGQLHVEVAVERLKRKFGVEVELKAPKVPYKETIKGTAKAQGKHKRQTGGHGQYGDCWIELSPLPRGQGFEFEDDIVGGVIPRKFIPAVEKGVRELLPQGLLAGYPDRRRQGAALRRLRPRRRLVGDVVQDRRAPRLQEGLRRVQADPARADHDDRRDRARRVHGRHHRRPEQPPRQGARRRAEGPRPAGDPGARARCPRCSATRPTSAR